MSSNPFQTMQQITTVAGKLVIAINKVMDKPRVEEHTRNDLRAVRLMAIDIQKAVERAEDGKPIPGSTARLHLDALKDILQQVDTWLRKVFEDRPRPQINPGDDILARGRSTLRSIVSIWVPSPLIKRSAQMRADLDAAYKQAREAGAFLPCPRVNKLSPDFLVPLPIADEWRQEMIEEATIQEAGPQYYILHGPAGFGKTTLAIHLAHSFYGTPAFPAGIFWVDMSDLETFDLAAPAVSQLEALKRLLVHMNCKEKLEYLDYARERLAEELRRGRCLIILDEVNDMPMFDAFRFQDSNAVFLVILRDSGLVTNLEDMANANSERFRQFKIDPASNKEIAEELFAKIVACEDAISQDEKVSAEPLLRGCDGSMLAVHIVATYIRRRRIPHTDWKQMAEDLGNTMQKAELEIGRGSLCFPVIYQTMMGFREKAKGKSKGYEGSMFRNILLIFEAMSLLHSGIQIPFGILWLTVIGLGCSSTPQDAQNLQSLQNLSTFEDCLQKLVDFHILEKAEFDYGRDVGKDFAYRIHNLMGAFLLRSPVGNWRSLKEDTPEEASQTFWDGAERNLKSMGTDIRLASFPRALSAILLAYGTRDASRLAQERLNTDGSPARGRLFMWYKLAEAFKEEGRLAKGDAVIFVAHAFAAQVTDKWELYKDRKETKILDSLQDNAKRALKEVKKISGGPKLMKLRTMLGFQVTVQVADVLVMADLPGTEQRASEALRWCRRAEKWWSSDLHFDYSLEFQSDSLLRRNFATIFGWQAAAALLKDGTDESRIKAKELGEKALQRWRAHPWRSDLLMFRERGALYFLFSLHGIDGFTRELAIAQFHEYEKYARTAENQPHEFHEDVEAHLAHLQDDVAADDWKQSLKALPMPKTMYVGGIRYQSRIKCLPEDLQRPKFSSMEGMQSQQNKILINQVSNHIRHVRRPFTLSRTAIFLQIKPQIFIQAQYNVCQDLRYQW